jgi:hypothetical protein
MTSVALATHDRASAKLSSVQKRKELVQRQIEVQIEAYSLVPKDIAGNQTLQYYRKELDRINTSTEQSINAIDAQIQALETRKRIIQDKSTSERQRYFDLLESKTAKLEDPEPDTPAFRRLKADLSKLVLEEVAAREEYVTANTAYMIALDKQARSRMAEPQEAERRMLEKAERKAQEERERIFHIQEQERRAEMERAEKRSEEAKAKMNGPIKLFVVKIHPNDPYSTTELDAMKLDDLDDDERVLWGNKYREAEYREGLRKWDLDDTE